MREQTPSFVFQRSLSDLRKAGKSDKVVLGRETVDIRNGTPLARYSARKNFKSGIECREIGFPFIADDAFALFPHHNT